LCKTKLKVKITLLGTGTSQGVPVIGCGCAVCLSNDPRDKRLRQSALISVGDVNIVIDAGPDFRQQMLRVGVRHIDAILFTHEHNDHTAGLDDVRPFNFSTGKNMPLYGLPRVLDDLKRRFAYGFEKEPYPGAPRFDLYPVDSDSIIEIAGVKIIPIGIMHGDLPILGFRIGDITYLTDCKSVPDREMNKILGTKILVVDALHHAEHHSHFNLKEALAFIETVKPERAYTIHTSHRFGLHVDIQSELPDGVFAANDGLIVSC
jgi:phosphoribosyl 1,2-cyclic phosphate phosphodiesterase